MLKTNVSIAIDIVSSILSARGGSWQYPFAAVAIDNSRQYLKDEQYDLAWIDLESAAKGNK
jgi:hypothetical protein